jgi:hypothetical protein
MTRYGLGRIRSCEQRVCSAAVRRWREGLLARLSGAAGKEAYDQDAVTRDGGEGMRTEFTSSISNVVWTRNIQLRSRLSVMTFRVSKGGMARTSRIRLS